MGLVQECKFFSCHLVCFEIRLESQVWARKITKPFQIKMKHCRSQWCSGSQQKSQNIFTLKYILKSKYYSQGDNLESNLQCVIVQGQVWTYKRKYLEHFWYLTHSSQCFTSAHRQGTSKNVFKEPGRLLSMGLQRVGHDWATSLSLSFIASLNHNFPST